MDHPNSLPITSRQPAYRRIADALRNKILSGILAPGSRLPSTDELAAEWQSSYFTMHTALMRLVKEGWVERLHGSGTYVAEPKNRFVCAGIYYGENIWDDEESAFARSVHFALQRRFAAMKKNTLIFVDSRPKSKQRKLLPALEEAINQRKIQCLIAPIVNITDYPALNALALPAAFVTIGKTRKSILFNDSDFLQKSLRRLAEQGCRSVGLISHVYYAGMERRGTVDFYEQFLKESKAVGLTVKSNWVRRPSRMVEELGKYGYTEFRKLWSLREKPDGVIVYPDTVARGVIIAALEMGVSVPEQMKFVFHRNAHANLLCPFPVTWAISDENIVADGLIELVTRQFSGEKVRPILVSYIFKETNGIEI